MKAAAQRAGRLAAPAVLVAAVAAVCGDVIFRGRVFSGVDLVNYFLPTAHFARPWLWQGLLPLWNPMTFCGWPQVGDPQLRWFYPPNLLVLVFDPVVAFSIHVVLHVAFAAIGMWLYLRRVGGVGPWPAVAGAATFALTGFIGSHLMSGIVVFPAAAAWAPWVLLFGWEIGRPGHGAGTLALFAASIGAQIAAGAPQIVFYTWIALALLAVWRVYEVIQVGNLHSSATALEGNADGLPPPLQSGYCVAATVSGRRRAGYLVWLFLLGAIIGIALGGSSLLPSSELGSLSLQRGSGRLPWEAVAESSLAPRLLWLFIAPRFFNDPQDEAVYWAGPGYWEVCGYIGIAPLIALAILLAAWPWFLGSKSRPGTGKSGTATEFPSEQHQSDFKHGAGNSVAVPDFPVPARPSRALFAGYHLALAALALLLAFGQHNPLFRLLYDYAPGFGSFRVPARWLFFWQFAMATILAIVLDRLAASAGSPPSRSGLCVAGDTMAPSSIVGPIPKWRILAPAFAIAVALVVLAANAGALIQAAGIRAIFRPDNLVLAQRVLAESTATASASLWRSAIIAGGLSIALLLVLASNSVRSSRFSVPGFLPTVRSTAFRRPGAFWLRPCAASFLLLLIILADIIAFGRTLPLTRTRAEQAAEFYPHSPLVQTLKARLQGGRYLALENVHFYWNDQNQPELWANRAALHDIRNALGYYPLYLRWYGQFLNVMCRRPYDAYVSALPFVERPLSLPMLALLDTPLLLSYDYVPAPSLRLVQKMPFGLHVEEVTDRLGPAWLVQSRPIPAATDKQSAALLARPDFDPRHFAFVNEGERRDPTVREGRGQTERRSPTVKEGLRGKTERSSPTVKEGLGRVLRFERPSPTRIAVEIDGAGGDLLMISEIWHPGWTAVLDGARPAQVVRADHALIGVYVPAGRHRVDLAFRPASFRLGLYISLIGWTALAALAAASLRRSYTDLHGLTRTHTEM